MDAVEILKGVEGISFVQFDERDVVRHTLVQRIVKAYERYNESIGVSRQLTLKLVEPEAPALPESGRVAPEPALSQPAPDSAPRA
jgi:phosphate starvation-inducible PhoH-like protein